MKKTYSELEKELSDALNKIQESQEQKPIAHVYKMFGEDGPFSYWPGSEPPNNVTSAITAVYAMPPIPPELAELQRENAELRKQLEAREGWQLVPIEPTIEMRESLRWSAQCSFLRTRPAYAEMLKAAPKPCPP